MEFCLQIQDPTVSSVQNPEIKSSITPEFNDLKCKEVLNSFNTPAAVHHNQISSQLRPLTHELSSEVDRPPVASLIDASILNNDRVLANCLRIEEKYLPGADPRKRKSSNRLRHKDYFLTVQKEITPSMRKIVAEWMLQVCQEMNVQPQVFVLAVNAMDRFLAKVPITKSRLQLIGSVCLLLASKFKDTYPISGEKLIFYTDYSIVPSDLMDGEMLVLQELQWELAAVTSLDILDHILARLGLEDLMDRSLDVGDLKRRVETVLVYAATDYAFTYVAPSLLVASSLHLVIAQFLRAHSSSHITAKSDEGALKEKLKNLARKAESDIEICATKLLELIPGNVISYKEDGSVSPTLNESESGISTNESRSKSSSDEDLRTVPEFKIDQQKENFSVIQDFESTQDKNSCLQILVN